MRAIPFSARSSAGAGARALALGLLTMTGCGPSGWRVLDTGDARDLRDVSVMSADRVLAVGEANRITIFDGSDATNIELDPKLEVPTGTFYGVVSTSVYDLITGDRGLVLVGNRNGEFTKNESRTTRRMLAMVLATPTIVYAGGEGGEVIRKRTDRPRWDRVDVRAPPSAKVTGGWASGEKRVALVTDQGNLIELTQNQWVTQTVTTRTATTPFPLFGVWSATTSADLFAVGLGGNVYRRAKGTSDWRLETTPATQDLYDIFGTAPDRVFAVGARGTILRYDGSAWIAEASPTAEDLFAVHGTPDGKHVIAVGSRGFMAILDE